MLYDCYFKEILNPEYTPERLSALLSIIIRKKVTVKYQLPNDNTRIGDELSLVITDIVVELEDGTLANIEVQKLGYAFTGERASCYSADLLLRQYKRVAEVLCKLKLARIGAQRVASDSLFFTNCLLAPASYYILNTFADSPCHYGIIHCVQMYSVDVTHKKVNDLTERI